MREKFCTELVARKLEENPRQIPSSPSVQWSKTTDYVTERLLHVSVLSSQPPRLAMLHTEGWREDREGGVRAGGDVCEQDTALLSPYCFIFSVWLLCKDTVVGKSTGV